MTSKRVPLLVGVAVAGTALLTVTALGAVQQSRTDAGRDLMAAGLTSSVTQNGVQVTAAAGTARVAAGGEVPITVTVRSVASQVAVVDLEAYDPAGRRVFQRFWADQELAGGEPVTWTATWVPRSAPGRYRIAVGVFTDSWESLVAWNNTAAFVVVAPSGAPDEEAAAVGSAALDDRVPGAGAAERHLGRGPGPAAGGAGPAGIRGGATPAPGRRSGASPAAPHPPAARPGRAAEVAVGSPQAPMPGTVPTHFHTLAAAAALPSGQQCADWVRAVPAPPETRPTNATANATPGVPLVGALGLASRVNGAFTGTTEQILRWAACKWGIDEDVVRAQAAVESAWRHDTTGDVSSGDASRCVPGHGLGTDGTPGACPESFGILQVRFPRHQIAFPQAVVSTALNVDYAYSQWRECFVGTMSWLDTVEHGATYVPGDLWGCVGVWATGRWHTAAAGQYVTAVTRALDQRVWTTTAFRRR